MTIEAVAPGKMILIGEYAVLHGAPALVSAVNREARVRLEQRSEPGVLVDAPDVGLENCALTLRGGIACTDDGQDLPKSLKVVAAVLEYFSSQLEPRLGNGGLRVSIDTSGFVQEQNGFKLGLGSSAAVTVALTRAMMAYLEIEGEEIHAVPLFQRAHRIHQKMQGGIGSGLDIAASVFGGLVAFDQVKKGQAASPRKLASMQWPSMAPVFVGNSASTPDLVSKVNSFRAAKPDGFAALMAEMGTVSSRVIAASQQGDLRAIREGCMAYCGLMQRLGEASGADIISDAHRRLRDLSVENGFDYKPSGAGGGDLGLVLGEDQQALEDLRPKLEKLGASWTELGISSLGARLVTL